MLNAFLALIVVLGALLALPWLLKWMQRKTGLGGVPTEGGAKVLSAVALGPSQRLVTVEVGPPHARVQLELGVTAQSVNCLHATPVGASPTMSNTSNSPENIANNSMNTRVMSTFHSNGPGA